MTSYDIAVSETQFHLPSDFMSRTQKNLKDKKVMRIEQLLQI